MRSRSESTARKPPKIGMPAADNEESRVSCGGPFPHRTPSLHRSVVSRADVRWRLLRIPRRRPQRDH
eukprot:1420919-Lingulodinium_polyedra.AAC.1